MSALTEDVAKARLAERGLAVPQGIVARSIEEARESTSAQTGSNTQQHIQTGDGMDGRIGALRR